MMGKPIAIGTISVFITWTVLDFIFHGVVLREAYDSTAQLWRPMEEAKMGLNSFTVLVSALMFSSIYSCFINNKSLKTGAVFGLLFGVATGISMGYGMYAFMPIPYFMAIIWCTSATLNGLLGGLLLGFLIKDTHSE